MEESIKEEIKKFLKEVEEKLQIIENKAKIFYEKGPPIRFIPLLEKEKISFPKGYIRTRKEFEQKYRFKELFPNNITLQKNLSYALQSTDVFCYFLNRFDIGLSAGKIFIKMGIINLFSIIEGILYGIIEELHLYCKGCRWNKECEYYIKKPRKYNFSQIIDIFTSKDLFPIDENVKSNLLSLKTLRDNVHIWIAGKNEFLEGEYNIKNYNRLMKILYDIPKILPEKLRNFKTKRETNCSCKVGPRKRWNT